jgi:4'-phosphopantetheinyl transferase
MEPIDSGEAHLWLCFYESIRDPVLLNGYRRLLSADELRQQRRFRFERDRHRYLVTRALVRTVLSKYAAIAPEQWLFATNPYGRPEVVNEDAGARRLVFNLSHTSGLIVLGVTRDRALGVDVENLREQRAAVGIADRFFAPDEVTALRALPAQEQEQRFFQYWTLKESYIKARGIGLSIPLDRFAFDIEDRGEIRLTIAPSLEDCAERWAFWQLESQSQYSVAVCVGYLKGIGCSLWVRRTVPLLNESVCDCLLLRAATSCTAAAARYPRS